MTHLKRFIGIQIYISCLLLYGCSAWSPVNETIPTEMDGTIFEVIDTLYVVGARNDKQRRNPWYIVSRDYMRSINEMDNYIDEYESGFNRYVQTSTIKIFDTLDSGDRIFLEGVQWQDDRFTFAGFVPKCRILTGKYAQSSPLPMRHLVLGGSGDGKPIDAVRDPGEAPPPTATWRLDSRYFRVVDRDNGVRNLKN